MIPDVLHALALIALGGVAGLVLGAFGLRRAATAATAALTCAGAAIGLWVAADVLRGGPAWEARAAWPALEPGRLAVQLHVGVDPLSALFLLPIFLVGALGLVYAHGYLAHRADRAVGPHLFAYALLLVSMALVVIARDAVLFMFVWELMTLLTFVLVSFDDEAGEVRYAAFLYVTISHVAALLVLAFWLLVSFDAGSQDLAAIAASAPRRTGLAGSALFALALVGFGTKLGVAPLHVWLPRAHPAAPSHVSALMSGVVVKTALYALLRALTLLGPPPMAWGYVLLGLGVVTGLGGILFGLAQGDLKRLLAYSTVENVGLILIGLGVGLLGVSSGRDAVAALGFTGALLHVLHHAVMKALLFSAAGAVVHGTHTRALDRMGGVLRRMPATGATLVVGALAISAAPGLAGFASELVVYAALMGGTLQLPSAAAATSLVALAGMALIGGLAAATFTKVVAVGLLGEPRTPATAHAVEAPPSMTAPLLLLAGLCVGLGLVPTLLAAWVAPLAASLARIEPSRAAVATSGVVAVLASIGAGVALLVGLAVALALLRALLLRGRPVGAERTWGCGYGAPSARMQYSHASFAGPLVHVARALLRPRSEHTPLAGYFPPPAARATTVDDPAEERVFVAGVRRVRAWLLSLRWLQQGRLQLYLLYMLVTIVALLAWQMLSGGLA